MNKNNETVGISAEVAIAESFNVPINLNYAARGNRKIIDRIKPCLKQAFLAENIPMPQKHVAEGQNSVDFILSNGQTLSVKTNESKLGKIAPQIIGQPTDKTYFDIMRNELNYNVEEELLNHCFQDTYENRSYLFKKLSLTRTSDVLNIYWKYMFDCDYLIHFYDVLTPNSDVKYKVFLGNLSVPNWNCSEFSFSQTLDSWNESCVLKYKGYSIGEFQVHKHRNCFKFRFNIDKLINII